MVKRIIAIAMLVGILICIFVMPVSADHTIGRVVEDCSFVGISHSNSAYRPYRFAFDDVVYKFSSGQDYSLSAGSFLYLYYDIPDVSGMDITFSASVSLCAPDFPINKLYWYGWNQDGTNYGYRTYIQQGNIDSYVSYMDYTAFNISPATFDPSGFDKICIAIDPSSAVTIDGSYDESVDLSGTVDGYLPNISGTTSSGTGTIGASNGSIYTSSNSVSINSHPFTIDPILFETYTARLDLDVDAVGTIQSDDNANVMAASTMSATYGDDGGLVDTVNSISSDVSGLSAVIESESTDIQSGISTQTSSINSKLNTESDEIQKDIWDVGDMLNNRLYDESNVLEAKLDTESAEIQTKLNTESSEIQTKLDTESSELQTKLNGESEEIQVDIWGVGDTLNNRLYNESNNIQKDIWDVGDMLNNRLFDESNDIQAKLNTESDEIQNDIVVQTNKLSDQLQVIVDDYEAKTEQAGVISQGATQSNIDNTAETMSAGYESLSAGAQTAGNLASYSSPAGMYTGLLTVTVSPLLNFGNGVLYWAFFAILIGSVILLLLRRLT